MNKSTAVDHEEPKHKGVLMHTYSSYVVVVQFGVLQNCTYAHFVGMHIRRIYEV